MTPKPEPCHEYVYMYVYIFIYEEVPQKGVVAFLPRALRSTPLETATCYIPPVAGWASLTSHVFSNKPCLEVASQQPGNRAGSQRLSQFKT